MPSVKAALRRVDAQQTFIAGNYGELRDVVEIARAGLRVMQAHEPETVAELQATFIRAMRERLAAEVTPQEMTLMEELLTDFGPRHRTKLARLSRLIEIEQGKTLCAHMGDETFSMLSPERDDFIKAELRRAFDAAGV